MGVKLSSIIFLILAIFITKISVDNFNHAQADDSMVKDPTTFTR